MLKKLSIALAQVKSENILNKILQTTACVYWAKETTKNVYNNIMNSVNI